VLAVPDARRHFSWQAAQRFRRKLQTVKSMSNHPAFWTLGITKLCRQQAEVIQNHKNEHVHSIGQDKENIRGFNLAAIKLTIIHVIKLPL
jgi:hypothetical protein